MTQPEQEQPAPPSDSTLVHQIGDLLLIGAGIVATVAAIKVLLSPLKLAEETVEAAVKLALRVGPLTIDPTNMPGSVFKADGGQGEAARNTRESEVYYRAAYLLNAAKRIERNRKVKGLRSAVKDERRFFLQHRDAQSRRLEAARTVDVAAAVYGPTLGWHATNDNRTSAECKAAHGRNFPVGRRPAIGYPGTVHPNCRCRPGAPFEGAAMLPLSRRPPRRTRKVA